MTNSISYFANYLLPCKFLFIYFILKLRYFINKIIYVDIDTISFLCMLIKLIFTAYNLPNYLYELRLKISFNNLKFHK